MASTKITSSHDRNPIASFARLTSRALESIAEANGTLLRLLVRGPFGRRRSATEERESDLARDFPHLVRLFRSALGSNADEFTRVLSEFTENSDRIQRAVIVWLDLIEVLVHDAERRHGSKPGQGKLKSNEVKQTLSYLLRSRKFSLPNVPEPLMALLMDSLVDWGIDIVVLQANQYDLWEDEEVRISFFHKILDALKRVFMTVVVTVANNIAIAILFLRDRLQPRPVISPALRAAVDAILEEGEIPHEVPLVVRVSRLFIWLGTHRAEIIDATELIFGAVQEAETLINMSGPEKKEFARDVIWEVLEEMGLALRGGLAEAIMDSVIDLLIEFAVHAFNKRGAFVQDSAETDMELA
jgi:hypothetical protein